jgi:hypothetical protein
MLFSCPFNLFIELELEQKSEHLGGKEHDRARGEGGGGLGCPGEGEVSGDERAFPPPPLKKTKKQRSLPRRTQGSHSYPGLLRQLFFSSSAKGVLVLARQRHPPEGLFRVGVGRRFCFVFVSTNPEPGLANPS